MKHPLPPIEPPKDPALHDVWRIVELGRILNLKRRLGLQITIPKDDTFWTAARDGNAHHAQGDAE